MERFDQSDCRNFCGQIYPRWWDCNSIWWHCRRTRKSFKITIFTILPCTKFCTNLPGKFYQHFLCRDFEHSKGPISILKMESIFQKKTWLKESFKVCSHESWAMLESIRWIPILQFFIEKNETNKQLMRS